uniref:Uncharacterized protein n=1 Tax=Brassica oleracea var. oleracea TaxID=109376 RepID=A0A0D2ZRH9_BRAOL
MRPRRYQSTTLHQHRSIVTSLCRSTLSRNQSWPPTLNLKQLLVLGLGIHGIGFFKQVWKVESEQDLVATTIKACFIRIPAKRIRMGLGGGNHQDPDTCLKFLHPVIDTLKRDCPFVLLEDKQKDKSGGVDRP